MAINDTLGIPSGIRRSYLPFVPKSDPGFFTFKGHSDKANIITPFSKNLGKLVAYDSGINLTHDQKKAKLELEQYLNYIPSLQIREYMPDPKLTQLFKWIDAFRAGFKSGQEAASEINAETFSLDRVWAGMQNIRNQINQKFQELTMDSAIGLRTVIAGLGPEHFQDMKFPFGSDQKFAVLYTPFILYYRLNTTTTTNIYEIPFDINVSHNTLMHSDGTYGWGAGDAFSAGIIGLKGESLASKILGLNTLKTNMMPSFNPDGTTKGLDFSIEFTLINDTAEGAANNYIMLHNLFGNNRWLQYGFVQAPASLYDVKVPGANRYFMCKGQFSCTAVGGFRTPSNLLCNKIVESSSGKRPEETMYSFSQAKEKWNQDIAKAIENSNKAGELEVQRLREELAREELKEKLEETLGVSLDTELKPSNELTQASTEYQALSDSLDETKNEMARIDNDIFAVESEQNVILSYVGESMGEFSAEELRGFIPDGAQIISDSDARALQIKEGEGEEELTDIEKDNLYNYRLSKLADLKDEVDQLKAEKSDVIKNEYAPKSEQFTEAQAKLQKLQQNEDNERYIRQQLELGILQQYDTGQELNIQNAAQRNVITKVANLNNYNISPDTYKSENSESLARYMNTDEIISGETNPAFSGKSFIVQTDTRKPFNSLADAYSYFQNNEDEQKKYPNAYKAVIDAYNRVRYDYATTDVSKYKFKNDQFLVETSYKAFYPEKIDPIKDKNGKEIILTDSEKNIIKESEQQLKNSNINVKSTSTVERTSRNVQLEKREEQELSRKDQISNQINETIEKTKNRADWLQKTSDDTFNKLEAQEQSATQLKQTSGDLDSSANVFVQREYFKIPDAYKVKLQFTSLLPDNFNNFLYGFRNDNLDPVQHYALGGKGPVDHSVFETMFEQLKNFMK